MGEHAHPDLVAGAVAAEPAPSGWLVLDILLAAVAEKLADDTGLLPPPWCANRPVLTEPWTAPTRRVEAVASAPIQFARRGLRIPPTAIWRSRPEGAKQPAV